MVLKLGSRETNNRTMLRSVLVTGVYSCLDALHACLVSPICWEHEIFGVILITTTV